MGGLISLYGFLRRPDIFGFAGVMSPSLWFARGAIFGDAQRHGALERPALSGHRHGGRAAQVRHTREMVRMLRRKARQPRLQLRYVEDRGAAHNEAAWAARFERAIRWLMPRQRSELNW